MLNISVSPKTTVAVRKITRSRVNFQRGIRKGTMDAGESVVKRAQTLLKTGIRTGRKYSGLPNRSSAPGEMPRSQSGRLVNSLYSLTGGTDNFRVGASVKWAKILSEGAPSNNLKPRRSRKSPWLLYVINLERNITRGYLDRAVLRAIQ